MRQEDPVLDRAGMCDGGQLSAFMPRFCFGSYCFPAPLRSPIELKCSQIPWMRWSTLVTERLLRSKGPGWRFKAPSKADSC